MVGEEGESSLLPVGAEVAWAFLCGVVLGADAGFDHEDVCARAESEDCYEWPDLERLGALWAAGYGSEGWGGEEGGAKGWSAAWRDGQSQRERWKSRGHRSVSNNGLIC